MVEVIPLKYGVTFKRVFSKPNIFREFVKDVTGIEVHVDQIYTKYEHPEPVGNVKIKYDIFAEDIEQRVVIEIQHIKEEDFFYRFLYYHLISIIEQVNSYEEYASPKAVYTIVVLTSVPQDGSIQYSWGQHLMNLITEHEESIQIAPHRLIFLNPHLRNPKTPKAILPWMELIEDSLDRQIDEQNYASSTFQQIIQEIRRGTLSPQESAEIKDESAWEMAKARFHQEGHEEGLQEGLQEGEARGHRRQQEESAQVMLAAGIDLTIIAQATQLTVDEIRALSEEQ